MTTPDDIKRTADGWIKQTVIGENGNCHSAVIASLLKIPIDEAWHFSQVPEGSSWIQHLSQWAAKRGLTYLMWRADSGILPQGFHEIHGDGGRGWGHVVLGENGKAVFDPHPDNTFLKTTEWYGKFIPCGLMLNYAIKSDALSSRDQGYQEGVEDAVKVVEKALVESGFAPAKESFVLSSLKDKLKPKEKGV